jgi:hypothetical protein
MSNIGHERKRGGPPLGKLVKILFELEEKRHKDGYATETMWAEEVASGRYRLRNIPFHVYEVSFEDIVFAKYSEGILSFSGVSMRGGHSTYRLFLSENLEQGEFVKLWNPIEKLGCTYEGATKRLLAVDVPPHADIYEVYKCLEKGEAEGVWHFEEGHCGHPLKAK